MAECFSISKSERKCLGVIGGLGPLATVYFMEQVIGMTEALTDQEHLDMIVINSPGIPDRTGFILDRSKEDPLPEMISIARKLEMLGADNIAVPCITAHYFYDMLNASVDIPVINAVTETVDHLAKAGFIKFGLAATDGTISSGLFQKEASAKGMECILPDEICQKDLMKLIYDDIKAGKEPDMKLFHAVVSDLRNKGAQMIVLGCTELSLLKRDELIGPGFIDVTDVLARVSVITSGGQLKKEYFDLTGGIRIFGQGENDAV